MSMEKMLPLGKTQTIRNAYCTTVFHVIGYRNGHNIWAEKYKRYETNHY